MPSRTTSELEALGEKFLEWPAGGVTLRPNDPPPPGLRLSTDCPSRRILEFFEDHFSKVNEGVSLTGHMMADLFIQSNLPVGELFPPEESAFGAQLPVCEVEMPVPWSHGLSRLDAVVHEGPLAAHYELKTSSSKNPKPSADQRRQVIRQRVAAQLAGIELPPSVIFIMGKSGHTSCYVYGPFPIEPTDDELESTIVEFELVDLVMADIYEDCSEPRDHPLLRELCRCSDCFPPEPVPADEALSVLLDGEYEERYPRYLAEKNWYDDVREKVKQIVGDSEQVVETGRWRVSVGKSGRVSIKPRRVE